MSPRTLKMLRLLLIFTVLTSCVTSVAATEAEAAEPVPETAATPEEPVAEPVPLDCTTGGEHALGRARAAVTGWYDPTHDRTVPPLHAHARILCATELLERIDAWSVDCVALWLENLGFGALRPNCARLRACVRLLE